MRDYLCNIVYIFKRAFIMKKIKLIMLLIVVAFLTIAGTIDLSNLNNYANLSIPNYITKDNSPTNNQITDKESTLGRVLFYDQQLSINNTIACASCHKQEFAFGDTAMASLGVSGTTGRHSMRLVNTRYANESNFFWDERASSLEAQTTMPIQDHIEMGFSGTNGNPGIDSLTRKLSNLDYYNDLFSFVYGDTIITEERIQKSLAQFIRSIQSFDSKFDVGLSQSNNINTPFINFSPLENQGKNLFLTPPQFNNNGMRISGGAGCNECHQAPEFDIDPNSGNNGIVGTFGSGLDFTVTRSPTLRDIVNGNGIANGPFMHIGISSNLITVINHYDSIIVTPNNTSIDNRLTPGGNPQFLNLTNQEKAQLVSFLKTLSGNDIYSNPKWSNPFTNGTITVGNSTLISLIDQKDDFLIYPNPANSRLNIIKNISTATHPIEIYDMNGKALYHSQFTNHLDISDFENGVYFLKFGNTIKKFIKN